MSAKGVAGTSMRALAKACDLNVAALYHYFDSKEALFDAVIEERQYGTRIVDIPPLDVSLSPPDRLGIVFDQIWEGAIAEERIWRLLLGEGLRSEDVATRSGQALLDDVHKGIQLWIEGLIPELDNANVATELLLGQLFKGFIQHILDPTADLAGIAAQGRTALRLALFDDEA